MTTIPADSLLGMELSDMRRAACEACRDADGYTEYDDLDRELDQIDEEERDLLASAEVLEAFADAAS